jgi:hypothetical protein
MAVVPLELELRRENVDWRWERVLVVAMMVAVP